MIPIVGAAKAAPTKIVIRYAKGSEAAFPL